MVIPSHEQASQLADAPTEAAVAAAAAEHDRPVRVLVQTKTHLVPGDKSTEFGRRVDAFENMICQHVWQRDYDRQCERAWHYRCEFALDNIECWFLVDHHGPDPSPPPDPLVLWYTWTGTEFVMIRDPLPHRVRRELRHYPFERIPHRHNQPTPGPKRPRKYRSRAEEIRVRREMLRGTLVCNMMLTKELVRFAKDNPGAAEWVRARVPPEAWARLDDPSEMVIDPWTASSDMSERPES